MENSVNSSHVHEISKKSRSFDLHNLPVHSLTDKAQSSEFKRKRQLLPANGEFDLGQSKKKRKSRKEAPLSSFESVNTKSNKRLNVTDGLEFDQTNNQVAGDGEFKNLSNSTDVSRSLDANAAFPKRPRCFTRRKKSQEKNLSVQSQASEKVAVDAQSVRLTDQFVPLSLSPNEKPKREKGDFMQSSYCRANPPRSSKRKDSATLRCTNIISKMIQKDLEKVRELKPLGHSAVDRLKSSVSKVATPSVTLREDDEENLEENAARMLSSRFDPSCTVFPGNGIGPATQPADGFSFASSVPGDFLSLESNHSDGLEANSVDAEGRILRPRRKDKEKHQLRKRRHFYEIFSNDMDPYWILSRRIKVFWPLDRSWYFGLVTSYDAQSKLHHVKYDDRDEEWINLQNERFKLLLLPSEVPSKSKSEKWGPVIRSIPEEDRDADLEGDSDIDSYVETEPIISWLVRSTGRVKSSLLVPVKRQKLLRKDTAPAILSDDSVGRPQGCLVNDPFRADASKLSSDSAIQARSDDKEISESTCSRDRKPHLVYSRKRLCQRTQVSSFKSNNSGCRSIVVYDPQRLGFGRFRQLKEPDMVHQCSGLIDLDPGCVVWSGENPAALKLALSPKNTKQVMMNLCVQMHFDNYAFGAENLWICHSMLLLHYGGLMVMWPKVQLEMLFIDNVAGLRFLLFEGCLVQAVAFVCLVLVAFHQANEYGELMDHQIPVTSIRFEISGFPSFRRRFTFVLYNFVEVKNSKWLFLDNKLKRHCSVTKQLPLSECTYDNIKIFQSRSSLSPLRSVCREPVLFEDSRRRSRLGVMHKRITKESAYFNIDLSSSSCYVKAHRVPKFLLPFAAAPTFFLSLHLKLLMANDMASITLCNPFPLLEHPEDCSTSVADDNSLVDESHHEISPDNGVECSLSWTAATSGLPSSAELEVDVDVTSEGNEVGWATNSQKSVDGKHDVLQNSLGVQDSGRGGDTDIVELEGHPRLSLGTEKSAATSCTPVGESHSSQEKRGAEFFSRINGITVQIPTVSEAESRSYEQDIHGARQSTSGSLWKVNDCVTGSPNPTAPRSIWHGNRHSSASLSFGYRSKMWPDGKVEVSDNGLVNGSRKPRSQISYMPFGNYDFSSKPRSHHRKGRPYKRMRTDSEKTVVKSSRSPQRRLELLSCDANVLITVGDRGWRECGAHVVLECVDHNEWRLLVKISDITKYSYKAYQFLQPGTTNRYTHAMMWKGGKDWTLEFPDRSQWTLFKEMHEECYNRNLRAASIKTIPIPGVHLIEEIDDNGVEVPFVRSFPKYFLQVETDVEMALNPSRVLYDMDSDDEVWISKRRASPDASVSSLVEISDEMFERTMDKFEKVAYTRQREDLSGDEVEELVVGGVPKNLIKVIYEYWRQKRRRKGMPLIRQLQPPLWERYQHQVKEWELAVNKTHHLPYGSKEKNMVLERPPMFAFCLRPRGLEVPNRGSKQRSHRKVSTGGHSFAFSRDPDGHHGFGRKSNGFVYGEERFLTGPNHEYSPSWQTSTRVISPRDSFSTGYLSMSSDGSERSHQRKLHRNKSKKIGSFVPRNESQMIASPSTQRLASNRNVLSSRSNVGLIEWPNQNQYHQREGFHRHKVEKLGGRDLDEFRLRDAASAAQHASNMAKLKRERAERLFYKADLAIHKAMVAVMTAEAMKASAPNEDG